MSQMTSGVCPYVQCAAAHTRPEPISSYQALCACAARASHCACMADMNPSLRSCNSQFESKLSGGHQVDILDGVHARVHKLAFGMHARCLQALYACRYHQDCYGFCPVPVILPNFCRAMCRWQFDDAASILITKPSACGLQAVHAWHQGQAAQLQNALGTQTFSVCVLVYHNRSSLTMLLFQPFAVLGLLITLHQIPAGFSTRQTCAD